jgi:hypothetical protein
MLMFLSSVLAAEATRCTAIWTGPAPGCPLLGDYQVEGTASTKKGAERAARLQLAQVLELAADARQLEITALDDVAFGQCTALAMQTYVNCFPEPALSGERYCFASFNNPDCWSAEVLTVETDGWRALEEGRRLMCQAVDSRLISQNYSDLALRRANCAAACEEETKVSCP